MRIGIYTVRKLCDNTVAMGLRFCLHEVVTKNRDQFATFFLTSTVGRGLGFWTVVIHNLDLIILSLSESVVEIVQNVHYGLRYLWARSSVAHM